MKVLIKKVYYCDYCKKRALRSLIIHEKYCTANPDRECRLCGRESVKEIIDKYKKFFTVKINDNFLAEGETLAEKPVFEKQFRLRDIVNELDYICPNCILTIIRCVGLNRYYMEKKFKFNYKKALNNWWKGANKDALEREEREMYYE